MTTINLANLGPSQGFRIDGAAADDRTGWSVSGVGDMNGDGIADLLIGRYHVTATVDAAYVVYGKAGGIAGPLSLGTLTATQGFRLDAQFAASDLGYSVSAAGDVNGDGLADLLVGGLGTYRTAAYVVYGTPGGYAAPLTLDTMSGTQGFRIDAVEGSDQAGHSVSAAGDVNGDGIGDIIIGAPEANGHFGAAYVVYGQAGGVAGPVSLASLTAAQGFRIDGAAFQDTAGWSVSAAGDLNGDGVGDVVVGAPYGNGHLGAAYVVYGKAGGVGGPVSLATLSAAQGFRLEGPSGSLAGFAVRAAGDLNGDGIADLLVGAIGVNGGAGAVYVVYGHSGGFAGPVSLATLSAAQGFRLDGVAGDDAGQSVSLAGDVNGDGIMDLLVGAPGANSAPGAAYVVYGQAGGFAGPVSLGTLDATQGFRIDGAAANDAAGISVSAAGDVNVDGYADVLLGAPYANGSGAAYVVYGGPSPVILTGTARGDSLAGRAGDDSLNGAAGDDTLAGLDGKDTLLGSFGNDSLAGGSGVDSLAGGVGNDSLDGGAGTDAMVGGGGDDTYVVDDAGDTLRELAGGGVDTVRAGIAWTLGLNLETLVLTGTDRIAGRGNGLDNRITGNAAGNALAGGAGKDTLDGAAGADLLSGGLGADCFRFTAAPGSGLDRVTDFSTSQHDRVEILLAALDPGGVAGLAVGHLSDMAGRFEASLTGHPSTAAARFVYETDTGRLLWDADGHGGSAAVAIAVFNTLPALAAADIWLV